MSNTNAPCANSGPSLLLIEPETTKCPSRAEQLNESRYCVTRAENPRDVFLMRNACFFSVAVLSDMVGPLSLRASAQVVREHWPQARILILGKAPNQFEDNLYDETVLHGADQDRLIYVIDKLIEDPSNRRNNDAYASWLVGGKALPAYQRRVEESDPTKILAPVRSGGSTAEWYARLQQQQNDMPVRST